MSIYQDNGYDNRRDYLRDLSETYGIDLQTVFTLADILGPTEDFDALVTSLEDFEVTGDF